MIKIRRYGYFMAIGLSEVYNLARPFIVIQDSSKSIGKLIPELNYMDLAVQRRQDGVPRIVRGNKSLTEQGLFNEVSAAFQFPYYFGENWDALDECLNDLDWLPATDRYLIVITDADKLLASEPLKELATFMYLLERTARSWESGANYEVKFRAYQTEVVPKKSQFAVVFQLDPKADKDNNFMLWLSGRPEIKRLGATK